MRSSAHTAKQPPGAPPEGGQLVVLDRRFSGDGAGSDGLLHDGDGGADSAELLDRMARLEAVMGATLSLLRQCILESRAPTREELASELAYVLGTTREAAMAELDEVAQLVGVSGIS
ncbi:MAG TPA: hypothetical protein VLZ06_00310 [Solirubrobacteraceae bacterium]|nr:hypothetical protein [Solirubrobacteraceae bacterium]